MHTRHEELAVAVHKCQLPWLKGYARADSDSRPAAAVGRDVRRAIHAHARRSTQAHASESREKGERVLWRQPLGASRQRLTPCGRGGA